MKSKPSSLRRRLFIALLVGFLLGTAWLVAVRFVNIKQDDTHYHANFAVYVDGVREPFDSFTFYEEVQSCGSDALNNPRTRVHMHDQINHVAHVHDNAATWGHLFANLGLTLGNELLETEDGVFADGRDSKKLVFRINGQSTQAIANQTIRSEDVLLISYGDSEETDLDAQYDSILRDAAEYNTRDDPSACTGSQPLTFTERLKKSIGF